MQTRDLVYQGLNIDELKVKIMPYREQEKVQDKWLKTRLETILPEVMKRSGIDMWIVACREYNEDPTYLSLVPRSCISARRKSILLFYLNDAGIVERYSIGRPGGELAQYYTSEWTNQKGSNWAVTSSKIDANGNPPESQYECLKRVVDRCNPKKIGLNFSQYFAFGDGLSHQLYTEIEEGLQEHASKICSAENIAVGWLETRSEEEVAAYTGIVQIAHALIAEAFSSRVIIPGATTNADVKYYMMQKTFDLGLQPWFDYTVNVIRENEGDIHDETVILPGDLLHCDIGFKYLGLCTDTQENCYILKLDEEEAPKGLLDALTAANRLQDITISHYVEGKTGNEILKASLEQANSEGLAPSIYTHPIGV
ncbi:MAG: M24 family metallopeptidase, partial [Erysipelotrichaceae bacterium]